MLLGKGQYEDNTNQIGLPAEVYAQIAVALLCLSCLYSITN